MGDENTLELLVKTTADRQGLWIIEEGIKDVAKQAKDATPPGEELFDKMGAASFRTQRRVEALILSVAGTNPVLAGVANRIQYVEYMAARMGMTVEQALIKFTPLSVAIGTAGLLASALNNVAKSGASALAEEGLGSRGWVDNFFTGLGYAKDLNTHLEKTIEVGGRIEAFIKRASIGLQRLIEDAGQPTTEGAKLKRQAEDIATSRDADLSLLQDHAKQIEEKRKAAASLSGFDLGAAYTDATGRQTDYPTRANIGQAEKMRRETEEGYTRQLEQNHEAQRKIRNQSNDRLRANAKAQAAFKKRLDDEALLEAQIQQNEEFGIIPKEVADFRIARAKQGVAETPLEKTKAATEVQKALEALRNAAIQKIKQATESLAASSGDPAAEAEAFLGLQKGALMAAEAGLSMKPGQSQIPQTRWRTGIVATPNLRGELDREQQQKQFGPTLQTPEVKFDTSKTDQSLKLAGDQIGAGIDRLTETILRRIGNIESRVNSGRTF